ncbi:MAG: hypothetical protein HW421_3576 [Ignavibacteria bacterium]|nr:hypothetical protein [Ignavibacteria bacterium]
MKVPLFALSINANIIESNISNKETGAKKLSFEEIFFIKLNNFDWMFLFILNLIKYEYIISFYFSPDRRLYF